MHVSGWRGRVSDSKVNKQIKYLPTSISIPSGQMTHLTLSSFNVQSNSIILGEVDFSLDGKLNP